MNLPDLKRNVLKFIPYFLAVLGGLAFFFLSYLISDNSFRDLVINIAAGLIAIPIIFIIYQFAQQVAHKKLNAELFDYAKVKTDKEFMSLISQLMKIVYSYEQYELSPQSIRDFLAINQEQIIKLLEAKKYVGFQIFKRWDESEKNFEEVLRNPFMLKILDDEQAITIIEILKSISFFDWLSQNRNIFVEGKEELRNHKVVSGKEINPNNAAFPNRLLLLEMLDDEKYKVQDFGDFAPNDFAKLLKLFSIDAQFVEPLASDIFKLLQAFNRWFSLTGKEFIFDPRFLRVRSRRQNP